MRNKLNNQIKRVLLISQGWLVGNAPQQLIDGEKPKDYDIIVPSRELFQIVCGELELIYGKPSINTYGGLKFQSDSISIDIWCEELSHFLITAKNIKTIYNLKKDLTLKLV